jgi:hypothetical protein
VRAYGARMLGKLLIKPCSYNVKFNAASCRSVALCTKRSSCSLRISGLLLEHPSFAFCGIALFDGDLLSSGSSIQLLERCSSLRLQTLNFFDVCCLELASAQASSCELLGSSG